MTTDRCAREREIVQSAAATVAATEAAIASTQQRISTWEATRTRLQKAERDAKATYDAAVDAASACMLARTDCTSENNEVTRTQGIWSAAAVALGDHEFQPGLPGQGPMPGTAGLERLLNTQRRQLALDKIALDLARTQLSSCLDQCPSGMVDYGDGICRTPCPSGTTWNPSTRTCDDNTPGDCRYTTRTSTDSEVNHASQIRVAQIAAYKMVDADGKVRVDSGNQALVRATPTNVYGSDTGNGYVDVAVTDPEPRNPLYGTLYVRDVSLFQDTLNLELIELEARNADSIAIHGERPLDLGHSDLTPEETQQQLDTIVDRYGEAIPVIIGHVDITSRAVMDALHLLEVHDPVTLHGEAYRVGLVRHRYSRDRGRTTSLILEPHR